MCLPKPQPGILHILGMKTGHTPLITQLAMDGEWPPITMGAIRIVMRFNRGNAWEYSLY